MSATEAQAAAAIVVLERMIDAARNGNQAGEDAVVAAAAGPDLLKACEDALADAQQDLSWAESSELQGFLARCERLQAPIAKATGSQVVA